MFMHPCEGMGIYKRCDMQCVSMCERTVDELDGENMCEGTRWHPYVTRITEINDSSVTFSFYRRTAVEWSSTVHHVRRVRPVLWARSTSSLTF